MQAGLARLRGVQSGAAMIELAVTEVCDSLGFERAVLFRVSRGRLVAESAHHRGDPEQTAALLAAFRAAPLELARLPLESEIVRRRDAPAGGEALAGDRLASGLPRTDAGGLYAWAPIVSDGQVVGFLHADRAGQPQDVDEIDQLVLSVFTEGFGYAFERTVLRGRLRSGLDDIRELTATTDQLLAESLTTELGALSLELSGRPGPPLRSGAELPGADPEATGRRLTRREGEVIELIAQGETNAGIAGRLLISESTVKSHVKHILRKLDASHRAEAVSHYLTYGPSNGRAISPR